MAALTAASWLPHVSFPVSLQKGEAYNNWEGYSQTWVRKQYWNMEICSKNNILMGKLTYLLVI